VSSSNRNDVLHANLVVTMERFIDLGELESASRANQVENLKRPCYYRWSSNYAVVCGLLKLYQPTFLVLKSIATSKGSGTSPSARANANGVIKLTMSFDFIFVICVMKELMVVTYMLCKKLKLKSQDNVNAMGDVMTKRKCGFRS
jgi:hypothetical protein